MKMCVPNCPDPICNIFCCIEDKAEVRKAAKKWASEKVKFIDWLDDICESMELMGKHDDPIYRQCKQLWKEMKGDL